MAYVKPQSPIKNGDDNIYPLTTYDQIIMSDNSRWDGDVGVKSVNRKTGNVTLTASDVGAATSEHTHNYPVTSVDGTTGAVTLDYPVTSVEGMTGDVTLDYPVDSVNGQTGAANLTYSDVGAAAAGHTHTNINTEVASVAVRNEINFPGINIHGRASGETMNTYKGSIRLDLNTVRNGYPDIQQVNAAGDAAVIVLTMNNLYFSLNGTTLTITKNY